MVKFFQNFLGQKIIPKQTLDISCLCPTILRLGIHSLGTQGMAKNGVEEKLTIFTEGIPQNRFWGKNQVATFAVLPKKKAKIGHVTSKIFWGIKQVPKGSEKKRRVFYQKMANFRPFQSNFSSNFWPSTQQISPNFGHFWPKNNIFQILNFFGGFQWPNTP